MLCEVVVKIVQPNILTNNIDMVARTPSQQVGDAFGRGLDPTGKTAFRDLGLTASAERDVELRIPMRRLFGLFADDALPLDKTGGMVVDLEMEDRIQVVDEFRQ